VSSHAALRLDISGGSTGRGFFGLYGVAGVSVEIARTLFFLFIVLFVVSLIMGRRAV
jgi:uncharacterized membrane protein YtjA (UPF0391 family)